MCAILICAHVIQSHLLFGSPGLCLEEDRLLVVALGTGMVFWSGQGRIRNHVRYNVGQLAGMGNS